MRAANGILGCKQVLAFSAGVDGNVNYTNYWLVLVWSAAAAAVRGPAQDSKVRLLLSSACSATRAL
jgi:hypothetical protein